MMLLGILLLIGIGLLIYFTAKNRSGDSSKNDDEAIEIIKVRYARGEITREEFQSISKELNS